MQSYTCGSWRVTFLPHTCVRVCVCVCVRVLNTVATWIVQLVMWENPLLPEVIEFFKIRWNASCDPSSGFHVQHSRSCVEIPFIHLCCCLLLLPLTLFAHVSVFLAALHAFRGHVCPHEVRPPAPTVCIYSVYLHCIAVLGCVVVKENQHGRHPQLQNLKHESVCRGQRSQSSWCQGGRGGLNTLCVCVCLSQPFLLLA